MNTKFLLLTLFLSPFSALADTTITGKIISTEGHSTPSCRVLKLKENGTGAEKVFRIADVQGHDDIGAVALSALIANREVSVTYNPTQTTGCGSEPKVIYITIY